MAVIASRQTASGKRRSDWFTFRCNGIFIIQRVEFSLDLLLTIDGHGGTALLQRCNVLHVLIRRKWALPTSVYPILIFLLFALIATFALFEFGRFGGLPHSRDFRGVHLACLLYVSGFCNRQKCMQMK